MKEPAPTSTGRTPPTWVLLLIFMLVNLATLAVLRRELPPGEFGTMNTVLGVVGLMSVPIVALSLALFLYLKRDHPVERAGYIAALRAAQGVIMETACLAWGGASFLLLMVVLPLLLLPRMSLFFFALLGVFGICGAVLGRAASEERGWGALWPKFVLGAAWVRLALSALFGWMEPWAESGLAALLLASILPAFPALRGRTTESNHLGALRLLRDGDFLRHLAATVSLLLGIYLFSSADRIVAQSWFGEADNNNFGYVDWRGFDDYQTAGVLARWLLWGTLPLLWIFYFQRAALSRTTSASLKYFWIYLASFAGGVFLLVVLAGPLTWLFCGHANGVAKLLPRFIVGLLPAALLQGLGVFALASRRRIECHTLGASGVAYALVLYLVGRQPVLMLVYMFGAGLILLMVFLFVGVVRYARHHP